MAVLMVHESPGGTEEQYQEVVSRISHGKGFGSLRDWPVDGILFHVAAPMEGGWRVIDIWESEDAFERFGSVIGPVLQEVGFPGEPKLFPISDLVT